MEKLIAERAAAIRNGWRVSIIPYTHRSETEITFLATFASPRGDTYHVPIRKRLIDLSFNNGDIVTEAADQLADQLVRFERKGMGLAVPA